MSANCYFGAKPPQNPDASDHLTRLLQKPFLAGLLAVLLKSVQPAFLAPGPARARWPRALARGGRLNQSYLKLKYAQKAGNPHQ